MQLTINEKKENILLNRHEIKGTVSFENATPSNKDIIEAVGKQMHADPSLIVIKHIHTIFSHREAIVNAFIYDKPETRERIECINGHMRKRLEEAAKKAA